MATTINQDVKQILNNLKIARNNLFAAYKTLKDGLAGNRADVIRTALMNIIHQGNELAAIYNVRDLWLDNDHTECMNHLLSNSGTNTDD